MIQYNDKLLLDYQQVFLKYNISRNDFENTLQYYSENPHLLENIYENILFNLKEEQSQLE